MKLYHGTTLAAWNKIQAEGVLWGVRDAPSRCTYFALRPEDCCIGFSMRAPEIVLEVDFPGEVEKQYPEQWQVRVYDPIPLERVNPLLN